MDCQRLRVYFGRAGSDDEAYGEMPVNFVLLFLGGPSWGWDAVGLGWAIVLVSIPVYLYRQWSDSRAGGAPSTPSRTERAPVEVAS